MNLLGDNYVEHLISSNDGFRIELNMGHYRYFNLRFSINKHAICCPTFDQLIEAIHKSKFSELEIRKISKYVDKYDKQLRKALHPNKTKNHPKYC